MQKTVMDQSLFNAFEVLEEAVVIADADGSILFFNKSAQTLLSLTQRSLSSSLQTILESLSTSHSLRDGFGELFAATHPIKRQRLYAESIGDQPQLVASVFPVLKDGQVSQRVYFFRDAAIETAEEEYRSRFVKIIGHELKHPLASIKAYLYLLKKKLGNIPEPLLQYFDKSEVQIDQLTQMLNDLTDLSKITMRRFQVSLQLLDLTPLVQQVVDELRPVFPEHVISLTATHDPCWVLVDSVRFRQLLSNLMSNAAKYSPPGSPIKVSLNCTSKKVSLSIADLGMGIDPEQHHQVFTPYFRGEKAKQSGKMGLGLGLYISQEIARQHGGSLSIESSDQGTVVSLQLPLAPAKLTA